MYGKSLRKVLVSSVEMVPKKKQNVCGKIDVHIYFLNELAHIFEIHSIDD